MDEPAPRPRFFTIMGWIFMLFGVWFPIKTLLDLCSAWKVLGMVDLFWKQWKLFAAILAGTVFFSALDAVSGWGLLKRRSWAPPLAALAGGMAVTGAGWFLYGLKGYIFMESAPGLPQPAVPVHEIVTRMLAILPTFAHAVCWMILLGALYREDGRKQFPPGRREFSLGHFWTAVAAGVMIMCLYNGAIEWILREPAQP
jgi:hypothetical protein